MQLTPLGEALLEKVEPVYRDEIHRVLMDFNDEDCRGLITELENVRDCLQGTVTTEVDV